jgi:heavy metal sensor kinase
VAFSLRTRLTAWYSLLLVLTIAVFSTLVLWLHWRLLIEQFDDGLQSICATASRVLAAEVAEENDLRLAARQMATEVRPREDVVQVFEPSGSPIYPATPLLALPADTRSPGFTRVTRTVTGPDGRPWRVTVRAGQALDHPYLVAVGAPLEEAIEDWRTLLKACLIGIPLALLLAIGGGWWLGRHGLGPLSSMAAEAQTIDATRPHARLTVPHNSSELEQLAESFNRVLDRLGSALATQRRFMADASHELRTPISIMRTAADVTLSEDTRDEDEYRDALTVVAQHASRLTRLVDDMLVLARADGGGYPIVMQEVDLAAVVNETVSELSPRANEKSIAVRCAVSPATLTGDEVLLRRLYSNLVSNALAYTPRGGVVEVSLARNGDHVDLNVADSGPGIPPEQHERIFERFVMLDPARAAGGVGLGLAIARWVAEVHHGSVRVASSGSNGSIFTATLPHA